MDLDGPTPSALKPTALARVLVVALAVVTASCSRAEPEMRPVPTVVGKGSPKQAAAMLHQAGFEVEFERPAAYCIPDDLWCGGPLTDEVLETLVVETRHGTQGEKRPAGSTITLILGSPGEDSRGY